jgi:hypothetical protein
VIEKRVAHSHRLSGRGLRGTLSDRRWRKIRAAEAAINSSQLTEAVAHNLFKLMAIKDEYEVARLYAETDFLRQNQR